MKKYCFGIKDDRVLTLLVEDEQEAITLVGYGNVFATREKADLALMERSKKKSTELSPYEQEEQYKWALSQMTEEERLEVREEKKENNRDIDLEQFLFAMEFEHIVGEELRKKKEAFFRRRQIQKRNPFCTVRG